MTTDPGLPQQSTDSKPAEETPSSTQPAFDAAKVKEVLRRLGPVGILALIAASLPAIGGFILLGTLTWSAPWLQNHGTAGIAVYIVGFAVLAGLALLPTYAQAVLAGFAFGLPLGSTAALCGIAGAATIGYLVARRASGDRVVQLIEEQPKWHAVYDSLVRCGPGKALLIVTLLRVPPNSPFAITNLVMAACRVRPLTYIVGTVVGIAPRTILAVAIGDVADDLDFSKRSNTAFFVGGIVVTLIVVGIIGIMANQAIVKVTGANAVESEVNADGTTSNDRQVAKNAKEPS